MTMPMPKSVRIGNTTYTVERGGVGPDESGTFDASVTPQIHIRRSLPIGNAVNVLVHELVHAGEYEYGLTLREGQVDQVAHIIISLIRHNPKLVAYLTATKGDK